MCEFQFWQCRDCSCHVFLRILAVLRLHLIDPSSTEHNSTCFKFFLFISNCLFRCFWLFICVCYVYSFPTDGWIYVPQSFSSAPSLQCLTPSHLRECGIHLTGVLGHLNSLSEHVMKHGVPVHANVPLTHKLHSMRRPHHQHYRGIFKYLGI